MTTETPLGEDERPWFPPQDALRKYLDRVDPSRHERHKRDLPHITQGESSQECLDAGLNCSIDPLDNRCTECGKREDS